MMRFLKALNSKCYSPNQQVHFSYFNVIKFADSSSHVVFVCTQMCQEHQRVVVFNLFHGRFSCQWVFDDVEWIHAVCKKEINYWNRFTFWIYGRKTLKNFMRELKCGPRLENPLIDNSLEFRIKIIHLGQIK